MITEYKHCLKCLLNSGFEKGVLAVVVALQAHMPAVHPEMTIWGVKGGPLPPNIDIQYDI